MTRAQSDPPALPYADADTDADTLVDHWWWRPGWQVGTRFYAWHVTVVDLPVLADHVAAYQTALSGFGFLDMVPRPWLHITMQGLDHTNAVTDPVRDTVAAAVTEQLAAVPAPTLTFARPVLFSEAVVIPTTDPRPLATIRDAIRSASRPSTGHPQGNRRACSGPTSLSPTSTPPPTPGECESPLTPSRRPLFR